MSAADRSASAAPGGFRPGGLEAVDAVVEAAVGSGRSRAASWRSARRGARPPPALRPPLLRRGRAARRPDTLYDLASLTKVVVTTTVAMILVDEGRLDLEPACTRPSRPSAAARTGSRVWHLLTHSSGLPFWAPLYTDTQGQEAYLEKIEAMDLAYEPGTECVYSDLGLIVLGKILEQIAGAAGRLRARRIFEPLGR